MLEATDSERILCHGLHRVGKVRAAAWVLP